MKNLDNLLVACSLTAPELDHREATLLAQSRSVVLETEELQDGYAFRIPGDTESIRLAANLIVAERGCCRFLKFELIAGPNPGPVIARLTRPAATKEFLRTILYKTEEST